MAPDLPRHAANHCPLTPLEFLARAAGVHADKLAVVHGPRQYTYAEFGARCRRLASALRRRGIARGDVVAVLAPNVPEMLEVHYGVPGAGAILNALNVRLDAPAIASCLAHGGARLLLVDSEFAALAAQAVEQLERPVEIIEIADPLFTAHPRLETLSYEALLQSGAADEAFTAPHDEWDSLCLLYTSGTAGDPKGVLYHHRGAYLNALGNALALGLQASSVYLWTLPMFHCSGWTHTWAVTAMGGTHVCMRRVETAALFGSIAEHGVTHLSAAPIVLNMLAHAPAAERRSFPQRVQVATGGAAPPSSVIAAMEAMGFEVTHLYGLTEVYGPATLCARQPDWAAMDLDTRARRMARQGVPLPTAVSVSVVDPQTLQAVPRDGLTMGEIVVRGNTVMKGYHRNAAATEEAFAGGWYHTGDLAVWHDDHSIEIRDRAKDIIISGGENISSLEVEECLYRMPGVLEAAVVAMPDAKWGEVPCAFISLEDGSPIDSAAVTAWCRQALARFKVPKKVVFGPLPKTSTGKVQKSLLRQRVGDTA